MVVFSGAPPETEVNLLPPSLPAFFLPRRGPYTVRPRAALDGSGSNGQQGNAAPSTSGQPSSSSPSSSSQSSLRPSHPVFRIPGGLGSLGAGIGIGGASFIGNTGSAKAVSLWPFSNSKKVPTPASEKKRILIMMSNTGGGHKASAEAIQAAFEEEYGDKYEIFIVDMWKLHTPPPFNTLPDSYSFLVKHSVLWRLTYEITNPKAFHIPYLATVGSFMYQGVSEAFDIYQPDLVVSVHPLMQHIPIRIMRDRIRAGTMRPTNFATVVTDFTTCHNTWFCPDATRVFVPTQYAKDLAKRQGMVEDQIIMRGLPIRPIFSKRLPARKRLRSSLGMDASLPAVLLIGGGEGMGQLEATVDHLEQELGDKAQVVVICGRNQKLLNKLRSRPQGPGKLKVVATGFVDNIHEWMGASDVLITKAGPGTIAEALISGLPILLNGNIPCQEEGNIPYVLDNGVGAFETRPAEIASIISRWLAKGNEEQLKGMAARSKALGRPEAVYKIVHDLAQLAEVPDFTYGPAAAAISTKQRQPAPASLTACSGSGASTAGRWLALALPDALPSPATA